MIISSLFLTFVYLAYYIFVVHTHKQVDSMIAKTTSMSVGMISNLLLGTIFGVEMKGELAISTIIAVTLSILIAFLISKPFGLIVSIEAVVSGIMGSSMGTMLGNMLEQNEVSLMLLFLDILFIVTMATVALVIKTGSLQRKKSSIGKKQSFLFALSIVIPLVIIGSVNFMSSYLQSIHSPTYDSMQHQHHMMSDKK